MASLQDLTDQIVALNAAVADINTRFAHANVVIAAQAQRIAQLEAKPSSTSPSAYNPDERRIDHRSLVPETFLAKDEAKFREWSEEFIEYIEGVCEPLAAIMKASIDSEEPIPIMNLSGIKRQTLLDVYALMSKLLIPRRKADTSMCRRRTLLSHGDCCVGGLTHSPLAGWRPA